MTAFPVVPRASWIWLFTCLLWIFAGILAWAAFGTATAATPLVCEQVEIRRPIPLGSVEVANTTVWCVVCNRGQAVSCDWR